ncbi:MAG: AraC family transcriptional regulator [Rhizobiales bacterium]|nr:AraC family transcriptional regulator [Hyphomicrobiales bacterium]
MPVLPVPMIVALLLAGFLAQRLFARETHPTLLALIAICAVQSALLALVQYYGVTVLRPVRPVMATVIPPVAWLAFAHAAGEGPALRNSFWHATGPVLATVFLLVQSWLLDFLIPLSFAAYGIAMLLILARGEDSLLHSRLESGGTALFAWRIVALSLITSAVCDVLIAYSLAQGQTAVLGWAPSLGSSLTLLSLGAFSLSRAIEARREGEAEILTPSPEEAERDQAIVAKLDAYVGTHKPYLDPDLTLARLSRKLIVPAKPLSAAINRLKGENVSRYINRHRIEHACRAISEGHSVTEAMLRSGFNTKSNFNREFLRVKGVSPSKWLEEREKTL